MNAKKNLILTSLVIKLTLIILIIAVALGNFFLFNHSYDQFIIYLLKHYHIEGKEAKLKALLTAERYFQFKIFTLLSLALLVILSSQTKYDKVASNIIKNLHELKNSMGRAINYLTHLSYINKIALSSVLILYTAMQSYYLVKLPFTIDEAFSYVFFISKGLFVSASYYPGPNNHVLFSELAVLFNSFIHDPVVSTRLLSLISSIVAILLLFIFLQKKFGFAPAFLGAIFFSFSSVNLFYSVQARGYSLVNLFVLISLISLQQALAGKKAYWYVYILASVLGFYTIPVFLYPFSSFLAYALLLHIKDKRLLLRLLLFSVLIVLFTITLYFPVLLLNGFNALTGSSWVAAKEDFFVRLPLYLNSVCSYLWNSERYGLVLTIGLLLLFLLISILRKDKGNIVFISCAYAIPLLIIICQRVLPYERVWTYLLIIQSYHIAFIVATAFAYLKYNLALSVLCVILSLSFITQQVIKAADFYKSDYVNYYREMNVLIDKMVEKRPSSIMVTDDTYNVFIRYKYLINNELISELQTAPANIDRVYQWVVLPVNASFPTQLKLSNYRFFYKNQYVKAYFFDKKGQNEIIR